VAELPTWPATASLGRSPGLNSYASAVLGEAPGQACFSTTSLRVSSTSQEKRNFAAVLTSDLESDGFVVVVDQHVGEEPFVVAGPFGPLWDGFVLYL
jgi:hypothetical protein